MTRTALTQQQTKVLTFVEGHLASNGFPPTMREIGQAVGLANINAVRGHLTALEKKGYITKEPDKARSIRVIHPPSALSRFRSKLHKIARTDEGVISRMVYGLAWATAHRQSMLTGRLKDTVENALQRECVEHGWKLLLIQVQPDHVRVIVEVWPNHSAQLAVRRFRRACIAARRRVQPLASGRLWQQGFAATTDLSLLDELVERMLNTR